MGKIKKYKLFEAELSGIKAIKYICVKFNIQNWTLNDDGTIDVDGDVSLEGNVLELTEFPLNFGRVTGDFYCAHNKLTSLEGSPKEVGGDFDCAGNELTSLEFCPKEVGGYFDCSFNELTSLKGCPENVYDDFACEGNKLTNLDGCPEKVYGNLGCQMNNIHSFDHYPTILTGRLYTGHNPIHEIWEHVIYNKDKNHGVLLELFWLNNPIRFEGGEWVCYREFLDNFFEEIGVPSPPKLRNYKEV